MTIKKVFITSALSFSLIGCWSHPSPKPKDIRKVHDQIKTIQNEKTKQKIYQIFFSHDSFVVKNKEELVTILSEIPMDSYVKITGFASSEGDEKYNKILSLSRAQAVNQILNFKKVKVVGLGETHKMCEDDTEECYKQNRRVEVQIIPKDEAEIEDYELKDTKIKLFRKSKSDKDKFKELMELQKKKAKPYKIATGDKFDVYVYGEPQLEIDAGIVKPDGTFAMTMIGDVKISGLNINQAMELLSSKLKRYLNEPIVSLLPIEFRAQHYTILGKVRNPGNFPVNEDTHMLDTIADGKGLATGVFKNTTIEIADLEHAFIRRGTHVLPVDFVELIRKGNPLHNIAIQDKDYIYIPSALNTEVYALGEVQTVGSYGYNENMTLMQIITKAGGYMDTANINQVAIIRGYLEDPEVFIVDLQDIIEGHVKDFRIKPFDVVFVPKGRIDDLDTFIMKMNYSLQGVTSGYILNQLLFSQ